MIYTFLKMIKVISLKEVWRVFLNVVILIGILLLPVMMLMADRTLVDKVKVELLGDEKTEEGYDYEIDKAIEKGLDFLVKQQKKTGAFGQQGYEVAITSLVGMAFMAQGSVPYKGKYGESVAKAVKYIISQAKASKSGFIAGLNDQGRMHGHSFAIMFLAQVYGEIKKDSLGINKGDLRNIIQKGIEVIEYAQSKNGGWWYEPRPGTVDENSVTVCVVGALRLAHNAGFFVNRKIQEKGLNYIKKCASEDGSFAYNLSQRNVRTLALTGAGVSSLLLYGDYGAKEVRNGIRWMLNYLDRKMQRGLEGHFYFTLFYTNYAMLFAGSENQRKWFKYTKKLLLARQRENGSFDPVDDIYGREYSTAFAVLTLQMPKKLLPMFQN